MRLAFGNDEMWARWAAQFIPHMHGGDFGPFARTIGVVNARNYPVGCVVFTDHMPETGNIQVSFAATSAKWLTRNTITAILRYPFAQLGVKRLTAIVPPSATNATQFLIRMGWTREGCIRLGFGNEDAVIWGLLEREWRFNRFNADRSVERRRPRRRRRARRLTEDGAPLH